MVPDVKRITSNGRNPKLVDGIICYGPNVDRNHRDYDASGLDKLYRAEKYHFWFKARREFIAEKFRQYVEKNERVIEIGAGTGSVSRALMEEGYSPAIGELHLSGLYYAKSYGVKECYQFDLFDPPFKQEFDVIGMFDVLEHLEDDLTALKNINGMLRENGRVMLTVPAHQWLWNRDDSLAGHKRRYSKKNLIERIEAAGFNVVEVKFFFITILPLLWLRRILNYDDGSSVTEKERHAEFNINPLINKILYSTCHLENLIRRFRPNIAGGSIFLVAQKPAFE